MFKLLSRAFFLVSKGFVLDSILQYLYPIPLLALKAFTDILIFYYLSKVLNALSKLKKRHVLILTLNLTKINK